MPGDGPGLFPSESHGIAETLRGFGYHVSVVKKRSVTMYDVQDAKGNAIATLPREALEDWARRRGMWP